MYNSNVSCFQETAIKNLQLALGKEISIPEDKQIANDLLDHLIAEGSKKKRSKGFLSLALGYAKLHGKKEKE